MGNLRDQMEALAQGSTTSAHEREVVVSDRKAQTARMLHAFGRERTAMAEALKSGLVADRVSRSANVCTIRANTGTMRDEFRRERDRMGRDLRRRLAQSSEAVAAFVVSLRAEFARGRAELAKAHRHMTRAQRAGLAKDRRDRSREVAELMNDFHVSRGEMAQELAESLAKSTHEIKSHVSGLNGSRASLQKIHEDAWSPRQIPNSLLAAQAGAAAPVPISAPSREPEARKKNGREELKTAVAKSASALVQKSGKPKKR